MGRREPHIKIPPYPKEKDKENCDLKLETFEFIHCKLTTKATVCGRGAPCRVRV